MFDTNMCQVHGVLHGLTVYSQAYQNKMNDATYFVLLFVFIIYLVFSCISSLSSSPLKEVYC